MKTEGIVGEREADFTDNFNVLHFWETDWLQTLAFLFLKYPASFYHLQSPLKMHEQNLRTSLHPVTTTLSLSLSLSLWVPSPNCNLVREGEDLSFQPFDSMQAWKISVGLDGLSRHLLWFDAGLEVCHWHGWLSVNRYFNAKRHYSHGYSELWSWSWEYVYFVGCPDQGRKMETRKKNSVLHVTT